MFPLPKKTLHFITSLNFSLEITLKYLYLDLCSALRFELEEKIKHKKIVHIQKLGEIVYKFA